MARRAEPAAAPAATTSFPRASQEQPIAASAALSRSRDVLSTVFIMLAAFALAFAGTMFVVFHDGGLALEAGAVCVVALGLFAAVSFAGRRTGP